MMISISASYQLNNKQRKTLEKIFTDPKPADVLWQDIESLFQALGAQILSCGKTSGSKIGVYLNGQMATFDKPHPGSDTDKGALKSVRQFLLNAEVVYKL